MCIKDKWMREGEGHCVGYIGSSRNWQSNNIDDALCAVLWRTCAQVALKVQQNVLVGLREGLAKLETSSWKRWTRWRGMGGTFPEGECTEGKEGGPGGASCSWITPEPDGSLLQASGTLIRSLPFPHCTSHFCLMTRAGVYGGQGTLGVLREETFSLGSCHPLRGQGKGLRSSRMI